MNKKLSYIIIIIFIIALSFSVKPLLERATGGHQAKDFPGSAKTATNFFKYKDEREEMIKMLVEGKIKKEDPFHTGFAFYYTPPQYKKANRDDHIQARMYGDRFYVFFQSVDSPVFGPGLTEGFLYSSTGKEPKKFTEFPVVSLSGL
ncbi:hypothetical protein [Fictibacillus phosphorivorans]|uniref:hypothetical protein n=1 Tax=Fictibacillus phosphorivorans TaxID=1221500 RepID=UPI00203DA251|nr:hypothetical protein [Fictibacillus phosphorivorans]MCM3718527.1 hypothetical protein [Fictibacillus phosphorivorans]MCM3776117.1 hypothetical protein [Fictibacillus phosphorivorans]